MRKAKHISILLLNENEKVIHSEDQIVDIISSKYQDQFIETEKEENIMLYKLLKATQGKEIVVENSI